MPRNGSLERWRGEVTAHLADIAKRLDEFGGRFEKALTKHTDDDTIEFGRLDDRIGAVEKSQAKLIGKVAIIAALVSAAVGAIAEAAVRSYLG